MRVDLRGPKERVWLLAVFLRSSWFLILALSATHTAAGASRIRTTLDDAPGVAPLRDEQAAPRRIRSTLDDPSRASFPPDDVSTVGTFADRLIRFAPGEAPPAARLIRLTLDDGQAAYGRLTDDVPQARRLRTTLD
jgi:hypothetical protein